MVNRLAFIFVFLFLSFVTKAQENKVAIKYTVISGDTFGKIAKNQQTKVDSLTKWNPTINPSKIIVGQSIIVGWEELSNDEIGENTEVPQDQLGVDFSNTNTPNTSASDTNTVNTSAGNTNSDNTIINNKKRHYKEKVEEYSFSWVQFLFGLLIGLALGVVLFYLLYVKKLKEKYRYLENELNQVKFDLNSEKNNTGSELSRLHSKIQKLEWEKQGMFEENISLGEEIERLKATRFRMNENRLEESCASINHSAPQASGTSSVLYADAIIDDFFVKVRDTSNEDSIFVLNLSGENSAYFTIFKPAYQRIVADPSFLDGCNMQILREIMQLEIVSEGRAQRDVSNGKWKVIEKLNVIIK